MSTPLPLRALLWDVDGTLAETERDGHRLAFNRAFEALGLPWHWSASHYGRLLHITGGRERILHDLADRPEAPRQADARERLALDLHRLKNRYYAEQLAAGALPLRPGVQALIEEAEAAGLLQGIATTTSRANVAVLLQGVFGPCWAERFRVCVCGEDVLRKKPDPAVYQQALVGLDLAPGEVLAIEDAPAGLSAARAAGIPVLLCRSLYFAGEFPAPAGLPPGALALGDGLDHAAGWQPAAPEAASPGGRVGLTELRA